MGHGTSSHSWDVLVRLDPRVPAAMLPRITAARADVVAAPAKAASVVLLRDGAEGLETYLLHRHARMPFAPSMVVFPGGRVDAADGESDAWPVCAVRETREETGVDLRPADLRPWAHWITPEIEPRRYDTYFYVAAVPEGCEPADISGETDHAGWSTVGAALGSYRAGALALMPPTYSILLELDDLADLAAVWARADGRVIEPVLPGLVQRASGWCFAYPARTPAHR
jgi:8-oxo-dGTP pyrophosphatase MutT (NUDIX family)